MQDGAKAQGVLRYTEAFKLEGQALGSELLSTYLAVASRLEAVTRPGKTPHARPRPLLPSETRNAKMKNEP